MAPDVSWLGPFAPHFEPVVALARPALEALLRAPAQAGWALLGLAALLLALGRHGQRALLAVLAAAAAAWAVELAWPGAAPLGPGLPSQRAALAAGAGAALGAALTRWARSLLCAAAGAFFGLWLGERTGAAPFVAALIASVLAFLLSYANERFFAVLLPPLAAGPALVAGAVRVAPGLRALQAAHGGVAALLIASAALSALFIPLAVEREARARRRREKREAGSDKRSKEEARAAQKAVFEDYAKRSAKERKAG